MPALDQSQTESTLDCVLVSLRLKRLVGLGETHDSIITKMSMGEMRPTSVVYMPRQNYVIFYGIRTLDIVF